MPALFSGRGGRSGTTTLTTPLMRRFRSGVLLEMRPNCMIQTPPGKQKGFGRSHSEYSFQTLFACLVSLCGGSEPEQHPYHSRKKGAAKTLPVFEKKVWNSGRRQLLNKDAIEAVRSAFVADGGGAMGGAAGRRSDST